jgi:hypothetical protein
LVYFVVIWYIFPVLVFCTKENLAFLMATSKLLFPGRGIICIHTLSKLASLHLCALFKNSINVGVDDLLNS